MTDYTYVPATGMITRHGQAGAKNTLMEAPVVGQAPPMGTGESGRDMDLDKVFRVDGKGRVPVMEVLAGRGGEHGVEHITDEYMSTCREIMLLPALLKAATYTNLHSVFTTVPLEKNDLVYRIHDGCGQLRDTGTKTSGSKERSEIDVRFDVRFDASEHYVFKNEMVDDLYGNLNILDNIKLRSVLEGMKDKHEEDAFNALVDIPEEVSLGVKGRPTDDKTIATKLDGIIRDTRTRYGSKISHVVMGRRMWNRYLMDPGFRGRSIEESSEGICGAFQLPGPERVTAVINHMADIDTEDVIYAVDRRRGALYGLGHMGLGSYDTGGIYGTRISEHYQYMITDNDAKRADGEPVERRTALRIIVP